MASEFIYPGLRDQIEYNYANLYARFVNINDDLNSISLAALFAAEVADIPFITLEFSYTIEQLTQVKTITFDPINVLASVSTPTEFNTIMVAGIPTGTTNEVIGLYQIANPVSCTDTLPVLVQIGDINLDFE